MHACEEFLLEIDSFEFFNIPYLPIMDNISIHQRQNVYRATFVKDTLCIIRNMWYIASVDVRYLLIRIIKQIKT